MKGKKAQGAEKITVKMLAILVIVLILAFFSARVFDWMTSKGDVESCRLSVVASGKISDVSMGVSTLDLECSRKTVVLSPEYYTVDDSEKDYVSEDEEDYATNVKQVFAEEMRECWYKMGEGEVDPFASSYLTFDAVCVVCSQIHFENPLTTNVGNLYNYLKETNIPLSVQIQNPITYHDYLYKEMNYAYQDPNEILSFFGISSGTPITTNIWVLVADALNTDPLTTSNDYTIFFVSFIPPKEKVWKNPSHAIAVYSTEALSASKTCDYIYS